MLWRALSLILGVSVIEGIMPILKCCGPDEEMSLLGGECMKANLTANYTESAGDWRWWFPDSQIISTRTNRPLTVFPADAKVLYGQGHPCDVHNVALLFSEFYSYTFFDNGSVTIFNNSLQYNHVTYPPLSYCVDRVNLKEENDAFLLLLCPCKTATCLLKCCMEGMKLNVPTKKQDITERKNCNWNDEGTQWTPSSRINYHLLYRFPLCSIDEVMVIPNANNKEVIEVQDDGSVIVGGATISPMKYCGDVFEYEGTDGPVSTTQILRCVKKTNEADEFRRLLYGSLSVIGCIFLIATLTIFIILPNHRTVHHKNVISQSASLLLGYMGIAIQQLALFEIPHNLCIFLGIVILYSFLASFFWLNVLCIDLAWTFGDFRLVKGLVSWEEKRRFCQFSIYGWASPGIIVFIVLIADFAPNVSDYLIKPEFDTLCWFSNDSQAKLAYFYGPIAVILAVNILLFIYTAYKIMVVHNASQLLRTNRANEKKRFILYIKLSALMGLTWILELVSWQVGGPDYYWYGTDAINLFRAVFMFVILCCSKQIFEALRYKCCSSFPSHGRQTASPSLTTTINMPNLYGDERRNSPVANTAF